MFVIILIMPLVVSAETNEEEFVKVAEAVKYFKTTTIFNNSSVMREANQGEMSSLTTEITKEEFDNAPTTTEPVDPLSGASTYTYAQSETTYKRLTTTILTEGSDYRYQANLYWKNIPKVRSYDIMGIGFYNDVEPYDSNYIVFNQDYCKTQYLCYTDSGGTDVVKEYGVAEVFHLPTYSLVSLEQTLSFSMKKTVSWTIDEQVAAGDYAHATKATTSAFAAQNFGIGVGGLIIYNTIAEYYDTTPAAIAEWAGTW